MLIEAIFDPLSIVVLLALIAMVVVSLRWLRIAQSSVDQLTGGLDVLRRVGAALPATHPIRRRLESAPVVELSLEEVAKLMSTQKSAQAVEGLLIVQRRINWIERFAQFAVHLGILGTVVALVLSDPSDLHAFRQKLPIALGTTFWGLGGTLLLSAMTGWAENELARANQLIRRALIDSFDENIDYDADDATSAGYDVDAPARGLAAAPPADDAAPLDDAQGEHDPLDLDLDLPMAPVDPLDDARLEHAPGKGARAARGEEA